MTQSAVISNRINELASEALIQEVFTQMIHDDVGELAHEDELIIALGYQWLEKNVGNKLKRAKYTSQVMRLSGRLLCQLKKIKPFLSVELFETHLLL